MQTQLSTSGEPAHKEKESQARRGGKEYTYRMLWHVISPSIKFKDHSYGREIIGRKKHPGPSRERESASVESRGLNKPPPPPKKKKKTSSDIRTKRKSAEHNYVEIKDRAVAEIPTLAGSCAHVHSRSLSHLPS